MQSIYWLIVSLSNRMKTMNKLISKVDKFLDKHTILWLALIILVSLRVPNFFDPYWYGDEAIYLTVGQSIHSGKKLYQEIVDHKTPIIYYLASVPNQFWFRVLLLVWMMFSTALVYSLSNKFIKNKYVRWLVTFAFVLLTTLPTFEGHIPNGELFVMGFVLFGLWLLAKTNYLQQLWSKQTKKKERVVLVYLGGIFFGLGLLTKVPALLDFAAILSIGCFVFVDEFLAKPQNWFKQIIKLLKTSLPLVLGLITPILLSILYYVVRGSGQAYLQYGLLYNFHYTQTWQVDYGSQLLNFLISLNGKTLLLFSSILGLSLIKTLKLKFKFLLSWFLLSVYAVLLSNRPYPHYFLQAMPPLVFLGAAVLEEVISYLKAKKKNIVQLIPVFLTVLFLLITKSALNLLNFSQYAVKPYYQNFYRYAKSELNQEQYFQTFNDLMSDNYQLSTFLKTQGVKELFIWGNNPMLYALSQTIPTCKFTVAFHVVDMKVFDETFVELKQAAPEYIVLMKNAYKNFPEFYTYLNNNYLPNHSYKHMVLYKQIKAN